MGTHFITVHLNTNITSGMMCPNGAKLPSLPTIKERKRNKVIPKSIKDNKNPETHHHKSCCPSNKTIWWDDAREPWTLSPGVPKIECWMGWNVWKFLLPKIINEIASHRNDEGKVNPNPTRNERKRMFELIDWWCYFFLVNYKIF